MKVPYLFYDVHDINIDLCWDSASYDFHEHTIKIKIRKYYSHGTFVSAPSVYTLYNRKQLCTDFKQLYDIYPLFQNSCFNINIFRCENHIILSYILREIEWIVK